MRKIGIITFHNSYNCGSMLESYAMQQVLIKRMCNVEIINFSSCGQRELYSIFSKNNNIKNVIKNILILPAYKKIKYNNKKYENFKQKNFKLTNAFDNIGQLTDKEYDIVVAGSDQIWNITIPDYDDAYFLPWVKHAKKIAYAPSFGAKNIMKYAKEPAKYKKMLCDFDALSIRENNGKKWINELCDKEVDVLIDPTLLLEQSDYDGLIESKFSVKEKYIFFYCPSFNRKICEFVNKISNKYKLRVITWSTKSYYYKFVKTFGFKLVDYESPSLYLYLIKNAELIITTSYHGTIFSTIYRKKFITVKNGEMYGEDDRVITLLNQINMEDRLIPYEFDNNYNYIKEINYDKYDNALREMRKKANDFIEKNIVEVKK